MPSSIDHAMEHDRTFRRNFFVIAALHVGAVAIIYFVSTWQRKSPADRVMWLEDGSMGGGETGAGEAAPEPPPAPSARESKAEPPPNTRPELISAPIKPAPSELVTPKTTPEPNSPRPATPKPESPKPHTPKPTPKPTPRHTPKPKPATPKATPAEEGDDATPRPKASPSEKPKASPGTARTEGTSAAREQDLGTSRRHRPRRRQWQRPRQNRQRFGHFGVRSWVLPQ